MLGGLTLVACGVVAGVYWLDSARTSPLALHPEPGTGPVQAAPPRAPRPTVTATPRAEPEVRAPTLADSEPEVPKPVVNARSLLAGKLDPGALSTGTRSRATVDRSPDPAVRAAIEQRALQRARERVEVVMYATDWCPACKSARAYLAQKRIPHRELNVDRDEAASEQLALLNPRRTIPTFTVDGRVLGGGFSGRKLERAIESAAKRRAQR